MRSLYMLDSDNLTSIVRSTGQAGVMGLFDLLALRAYREIGRLEKLVGAPLVSPGFGCFVFWVRHSFEAPFLIS